MKMEIRPTKTYEIQQKLFYLGKFTICYVGMLVFYLCCNKLPQGQCLKTIRIYYCTGFFFSLFFFFKSEVIQVSADENKSVRLSSFPEVRKEFLFCTFISLVEFGFSQIENQYLDFLAGLNMRIVSHLQKQMYSTGTDPLSLILKVSNVSSSLSHVTFLSDKSLESFSSF